MQRHQETKSAARWLGARLSGRGSTLSWRAASFVMNPQKRQKRTTIRLTLKTVQIATEALESKGIKPTTKAVHAYINERLRIQLPIEIARLEGKGR